MTEELKQAAQQALEQLEFLNACYPHKTAADAIAALQSALTQRPAAQEVDGPISASLGDIVALWDQYAPSEYMTAIHMQAKRALAGQQPMSPDMARWCAYVGGMVAHWVKSEPDALARLGDDAFEAAIAGIIERRLWAMPKPAPQQATPEWLHLKSYGYAPGNYMSKCLRCGQTPAGLDKRATSCRPCAEAAYADQQATPAPVGEADTVPLDALHAAERERDYWKTRARAMLDHAEGTCWYWMGDGEDHLESLVNSLPVVIRADQLRELLARPAPGVPEGFALVPVEPTISMLIAGNESRLSMEHPTRESAIWAAMLAAAQAKGSDK